MFKINVCEFMHRRHYIFVTLPCANVQPAAVVLHQEEEVLRGGRMGQKMY